MLNKTKILSLPSLVKAVRKDRKKGKKIVFTNGCFDVIHVGHTRYLKSAKKLGDILILGLNSDASVRRLKGPTRPIVNQAERAEILAEFPFIDYIVIFGEDTPIKTIKAVKPDFLAKGGDWPVEKIVGNEIVRAAGGKVVSIPLVPSRSTTRLAKKLQEL